MTLNTKKRCSIKSLPNHLIVHLKRFDFDFDTMQQTKVMTAMLMAMMMSAVKCDLDLFNTLRGVKA